jgi:hypothetical protein
MRQLFNLNEVAARYGVSRRRVQAWIDSGDLRAVDLSGQRDSRKPRLAVTEQALADFEERRSTVGTPQAGPRRRSRAAAVQDSFGLRN